MGCYLFAQIFAASDYLIVAEVQKELRMNDQRGEISDKSFMTRLRWANNLLSSPRGVGWSFAPLAYLLPPPSITIPRRDFIASKFREIALNVVLYDLTGFLNRANPCFAHHGPPVAESAWFWRLAMFSYGSTSYLTVSTLHCMYSVLSVGVGATQPKDWPSVFGELRDAYTVRRFWGHVWHQMMRRVVWALSIARPYDAYSFNQLLSSHVKFAARKLNIAHMGKFTEFFKLILAFFISAIIHYGGDVMLLGNWRGGSFVFFMLQPFAIAFEELMTNLWRRIGLQ